MLKQPLLHFHFQLAPAAFGRLCVETLHHLPTIAYEVQPPSGGCVLKLHRYPAQSGQPPAAFGRLCVETC